MTSVRIDYLADHLELAPLLAQWHYREWAALMPEWSLPQALADLQSHTERRRIPTTFIALDGDQLVGSASLLVADLAGWEHLSPWLASVYVVAQRRGLGIGRQLVRRAVEEARALAVPVLYLFTAGQQGYYERLGWEALERVRSHQSEVVIMQQRMAR